ncbi:MAG: c-type cytochrome [Pseudonocardiaceae bacterium]|nr:c-type cytochrome [Pseudonocardiaceae bacterium]
MTTSTSTTRPRRARGRLRRRVSGMLALVIGLLAVGTLYTLFVPEPQTASAQVNAAQVREGKQVYNNACITCHGTNLQGVEGRGPSLIGVGEAAVYFQVSTGRMPAVRQEAQAREKPVKFSPEQIDALGAYVQANGGGPTVPEGSLAGGDVAQGGQLFRMNCSSCHNFTGEGGALSSGKFAPALDAVTPKQIYTAMTSGPQNMPKVSDRQISPEHKRDIIAYIETVRSDKGTSTNPGGWGLGNIGPTSEGIVAFVVGIGALVGVAVWIGARA